MMLINDILPPIHMLNFTFIIVSVPSLLLWDPVLKEYFDHFCYCSNQRFDPSNIYDLHATINMPSFMHLSLTVFKLLLDSELQLAHKLSQHILTISLTIATRILTKGKNNKKVTSIISKWPFLFYAKFHEPIILHIKGGNPQ